MADPLNTATPNYARSVKPDLLEQREQMGAVSYNASVGAGLPRNRSPSLYVEPQTFQLPSGGSGASRLMGGHEMYQGSVNRPTAAPRMPRPSGVTHGSADQQQSAGNGADASAGPATYGPQMKLPLEEVKRELARLSVEIPESLWKDPQPEQVQGLFSFAIEEVFGATVNDIRVEETTGDLKSALPSIEGMQVLPIEGRLHFRAIGNLRFFRYCQRLCRHVLNLTDFSLEQIFRPTAQSVLRFASAFVHFLRFRESVYQTHQSTFRQYHSLSGQERRVDEMLAVTQHDLVQFRADRDRQLPWSVEMKQRIVQAEERLISARKKYAETDAQRRKVEADLSSSKYRRGELDLELTKLSQLKDDLEDQVVQSPRKLAEKRKDLQQQVEEADTKLVTAEDLVREIRSAGARIEKSIKRIAKMTERLEKHKKEIIEPHAGSREEHKKREKQNKELKDQAAVLTSELNVLSQNTEEALKTLESTREVVESERQTAMAKLRREKEEVQAKKVELEAQRDRSAAIRQEIVELQAKIRADNEKHQKLISAIEGRIGQVGGMISQLNSEFEKMVRALPTEPIQIPRGAFGVSINAADDGDGWESGLEEDGEEEMASDEDENNENIKRNFQSSFAHDETMNCGVEQSPPKVSSIDQYHGRTSPHRADSAT